MNLHGKGMFLWKIDRVAKGDTTKIAKMAHKAGLTHVLIKIADGKYNYNIGDGKDLAAELVPKLRQHGIQPWGWQYVYGNNAQAEADKAAARFDQLKLDGFIVNAEGQFKADGMNKVAQQYMQRLRKKLPKAIIGLSSYRYPLVHYQFPFDIFLEHCDFTMPQVYWQGSVNPVQQLRKSIKEYETLKHVLPIIPTGSAYSYANWAATPQQIIELMDEARKLGLAAVNFWEFATAQAEGGALWNAIAAYNWQGIEQPEPTADDANPVMDSQNNNSQINHTQDDEEPSGIPSTPTTPANGPVDYRISNPVVDPKLPTYIRLKHDHQWMTDPETGKRVQSRMELSDWNSGFHLDTYPAVVPLWKRPKGGDGAYKYSKDWANFLRASNPEHFKGLERVAAGLFNPRNDKQDPLPDNLDSYDGKSVAEGIGSTGNVYQVKEEKAGSVRVKLIDFRSAPPKPEQLNYEDTPWLVNAFTAVRKDGSLHKVIGRDLVFPNLGRPGAGWVPKERVEFFPDLPVHVRIKEKVNVHKGPSLKKKVAEQLGIGSRATVLEYLPQGSNVWGRIGTKRWILLVYTTPSGSIYYTNWKMKTAPPLGLFNPRPYLGEAGMNVDNIVTPPNPQIQGDEGTSPEPAPPPAQDLTAAPEPVSANDLVGSYFAALNSGDASKLVALYDTAGSKLVADERKFNGQKAIYSWYQRMFKNKLPGATFKILSNHDRGGFYEVRWTAKSRKATVKDGKDLIKVSNDSPKRITYHYTYFNLDR